jgi:hypothetical protein
MNERPVIDHNPNERRQPKWLWPIWCVALAVFWLLQIRHGFDWGQIVLGFGTGLTLGLWAMEVTGGEIPASWRSKTPRRR